jgi:acetylornithine deacetylase
VAAVLIANEECSHIRGIGVDQLAATGELSFIQPGMPLYWLDVANIGPVLGSGGMLTWSLKAKGKLFHSGFPTQGINAIHVAMETMRYIEQRFYADFPKPAACNLYKYSHGSSLKPTQIEVPPGSISQVPGECEIRGDIRVVPFDDITKIQRAVETYVSDFRATLKEVGDAYPGPAGFSLADQQADLIFSWSGALSEGVAVNMESLGFKAILKATEEVRGEAFPYSLTGTLPLIKDLQRQGHDVQLIGYGRMEGYHALNEFGYLSEFAAGASIVVRTIDYLNCQK